MKAARNAAQAALLCAMLPGAGSADAAMKFLDDRYAGPDGVVYVFSSEMTAISPADSVGGDAHLQRVAA